MTKLSDVGAERAVLSGIFQYGKDIYIDVSEIIDINTFTVEGNQLIYKCIEQALKNHPKLDIAVFLSAAHDLGYTEFFKEKTELEYIRSLFNFPIELDNIVIQAKKIKKLEVGRIYQNNLKKAFNQLDKISGNERLDEIISIAEKPIFDLAKEFKQGNEERPKLIGEDIQSYVEHLMSTPNKIVGIPSPWCKFNDAIGGGFRRKTVSLICARPRVGKSTIADNLAIHVAGRLNIPILMLDTEMSMEDHYNRLLAYYSKIPTNVIERAKFVNNKFQLEKLQNATKTIEKIPYTYKSITGKKFEEVLSIIRRWVYQSVGFNENGRTKDCLIIYDYFKLMDSSALDKMQEYQAMGFQVSDMHNFCVEYDVPVVAFAQLNRDGIDKELTSSVSQSDRLVWLCTNVSIFKTKTQEEILEDGEENGNRKLIPLNARHGPGLDEGNYINMYMQGQYAMIEEMRTNAEVKLQGNGDSGFGIKNESTENYQDSRISV